MVGLIKSIWRFWALLQILPSYFYVQYPYVTLFLCLTASHAWPKEDLIFLRFPLSRNSVTAPVESSGHSRIASDLGSLLAKTNSAQSFAETEPNPTLGRTMKWCSKKKQEIRENFPLPSSKGVSEALSLWHRPFNGIWLGTHSTPFKHICNYIAPSQVLFTPKQSHWGDSKRFALNHAFS